MDAVTTLVKSHTRFVEPLLTPGSAAAPVRTTPPGNVTVDSPGTYAWLADGSSFVIHRLLSVGPLFTNRFVTNTVPQLVVCAGPVSVTATCACAEGAAAQAKSPSHPARVNRFVVIAHVFIFTCFA